jgi:hypothetical protein
MLCGISCVKMALINCVASQVKKESLAFGESEVKKIRVCCGYSATDKNPRRLRNGVKCSAYNSFRQNESKICACSTQFVSCMINFRDTLSTYGANCITHFQIRVYLTMASG